MRTFTYKIGTHVITKTQFAAGDAIRNQHLYPIRNFPHKAFIFPNALEDRTNINHAQRSQTIEFIGRLDYSKGVDLLLTAFRQVLQAFPNTKLVIVGDGNLRQALERQAAAVKAQVTFAGSVSYGVIFEYMQSFTCLVVPSRTDNLPTVVLEAFSCYTPVIGSKAGGIPDMIEDSCNGLLFEKENAAELAEKLIFLLTHTEERNRLAANARQSFVEKYCIDTLPARFEQLLTTTRYL